MQDQLGKVGIKVNPVVTDLPTWLKKVTSATAHLVIYLPVRSPDADFPLTNFLHTAGFSPGTNLFRYNRLDREIDEARSEMDPARRLKIYHAIQKKLMEDIPIVPLFMMPFPTPYRPHLAGIPDQDPLYGFNFHLVQFTDR
jgi:peptide/nickel transport system substrate-binding protein